MEKSSKRGKIPQQDWPSIITRYEAGETLASIARTYDCSPPAISYIVSRSRARSAAAETAMPNPPSSAEPHLVKGPNPEAPDTGIPADETPHGSATIGETRALDVPAVEPGLIERSADAPQHTEPLLFPDRPPSSPQTRESNLSHGASLPPQRHEQGQRDLNPAGHGNGSAARSFGSSSGSPPNGEPRPRLHLPLPQDNGGSHGSDSAPGIPSAANTGVGSSGRAAQRPPAWQQGLGQPARAEAGQTPPPAPFPRQPAGAGMSPFAEPTRGKDGAFIDQALRERVEGDITAFLAAFDAALAHDSSESRTGLREATDRLLRAGARTRIELERLEARAPLPSRDKNGQTPPLLRR
jgi:hypothetical protein